MHFNSGKLPAPELRIEHNETVSWQGQPRGSRGVPSGVRVISPGVPEDLLTEPWGGPVKPDPFPVRFLVNVFRKGGYLTPKSAVKIVTSSPL